MTNDQRRPATADHPVMVAAAVIERDGRFLLTRRHRGVHLEGLWEFPGGKCEFGETLEVCLARELREELAVEAQVGDELFTTVHDYPERTVELHFFTCTLLGEASPQMGQEMRWASQHELAALEFPPADAELIATLSRRPLD
jgi:mutator protein MutT